MLSVLVEITVLPTGPLSGAKASASTSSQSMETSPYTALDLLNNRNEPFLAITSDTLFEIVLLL